jgi:hypothetical protein
MSTAAIAYWENDSLYETKPHKKVIPETTNMPQYDAYEDPLALSSGHDGVQPTIPVPGTVGSPLTKINTPDRGAQAQVEGGNGIYKIQSPNNGPFHASMSSHTHARHSSLTHTDRGTHLIPSTLTHSASIDPSPKTLNAEEQASLAAYIKAQADNDSIRLALACERCGQDLAKENRINDPAEFAKEAHMLNGGWMHRSRASCALLSERAAGETWETKDVESMRARPRGAL